MPVYIERNHDVYFKISIQKPIFFNNDLSTKDITLELNKLLEKMILKNPEQWIWTHDRWK